MSQIQKNGQQIRGKPGIPSHTQIGTFCHFETIFMIEREKNDFTVEGRAFDMCCLKVLKDVWVQVDFFSPTPFLQCSSLYSTKIYFRYQNMIQNMGPLIPSPFWNKIFIPQSVSKSQNQNHSRGNAVLFPAFKFLVQMDFNA